MSATAIFLLLLAAFLQATSADIQYAPEVKTKSGLVRGLVQESINNLHVHSYKGIRYGRAKRFEMATPAEPWEGVYNATTVRYACPQHGLKMANGDEQFSMEQVKTEYYSEDCLFLNIWSPGHNESFAPILRPVLVWIHGGVIPRGSIFEELYDGRHLAALGHVVVVSINYRLGTFGFLNDNQGLHDQLLALKWIHENIKYFGGSAQQITIFGESSGSMLVGAHLISPLTKGLFHRAIMHSGSPTALNWADSKEQNQAKLDKHSIRLNCSNKDHAKVIECLKVKPLNEIVEASEKDWEMNELFVPVYHEAFLPSPPIELLRKFNKQIDLLFGIVENAGSLFVLQKFPNFINTETKFDLNSIKSLMNDIIQDFRVSNHQAIIDFYSRHLTNKSTPNEFKQTLANLWGDYSLACPQIFFGEEMAHKHSLGSHSYAFNLNHTLSVLHKETNWMGAITGTDLFFIFGQPLTNPNTFTPMEKKLSEELIKLWTHFASSGTMSAIDKSSWLPSFNNGNPTEAITYMDIVPEHSKMKHQFLKERCEQFWKPRIHKN